MPNFMNCAGQLALLHSENICCDIFHVLIGLGKQEIHKECWSISYPQSRLAPHLLFNSIFFFYVNSDMAVVGIAQVGWSQAWELEVGIYTTYSSMQHWEMN
jgi:hypothetical protein